jgi:hypothetical protein
MAARGERAGEFPDVMYDNWLATLAGSGCCVV